MSEKGRPALGSKAVHKKGGETNSWTWLDIPPQVPKTIIESKKITIQFR